MCDAQIDSSDLIMDSGAPKYAIFFFFFFTITYIVGGFSAAAGAGT